MPEKERLDRVIQMSFSVEEADSIRYLASRLHLSASVMCKKIVFGFIHKPIFEPMIDPNHKPIKQENENRQNTLKKKISDVLNEY